MGQAITTPIGILIIVGVLVLLALATVGVFIGLRTASGGSRKAKRMDALRKIDEINQGGYLDDVGTIKIDAERKRRAADRNDR
jgi:hypothetical protein